ncbi:hypothetical protein [Alishewanella longhuensis]
MARVLLKQQSYTLAEQMLTDTIEQAKTYQLLLLLPELHLLLGYALQIQYGPTELALAAFQEATKIVTGSQPGRVQMLALNNLGVCVFLSGRLCQSRAIFSQRFQSSRGAREPF